MKTFKTGGVSFCWHCGTQLQRKKGGFFYIEVQDKADVIHRVHRDYCKDAVMQDGLVKLTGNDTYAKSTADKAGKLSNHPRAER